MIRALVLAGLVVACSKAPDDSAAPKPEPPKPAIAEPELRRAIDACTAYVVKACKCAETVPAVAESCKLSHTLPDAVDVSKRLAMNPKAERADAVQAAESIRKTVKQCIELTAKLPTLGCPQ